MTTPYFYIVQHVRTGMLYAGSKWGKDADPKTLMVDGGYTTSSQVVNGIISAEGTSSFAVLMVKTDVEDVYGFETAFLNEHGCARSKFWLNKHNNEGCAYQSDTYKSSMIALYGEAHPMLVPHIKDKMKRTVQDRYGVDNVSQSQAIKSLKKLTSLRNYGVEYPAQSLGVQLKMIASNNRANGVDWPMQSVDVRAKSIDTVRSIHGVDNVMSSESVQETRRIKSLAKHGVNHHNSTIEGKVRMKEISKLARASDPILTCNYCGKSMKGRANYNRWHGDNCKLKQDVLLIE